ncbi:MAG TPA: hypothetical protein VJU61_26075 [Polyangiaceae bacterium]|nr:hypothetical protein [Polyangiaceae bacterium]
MQTAQIVQRASCWGVWSLLVVSALAACAGSSDAQRQAPAAFRAPKSDYQQPLRTADGEVLGANQQDPSDTLRALPTNLHPAAGWETEKGQLRRARPGSAEAMRDSSLACARALAAPGEPAVIHKPVEASAEISRETALLATACDVPPPSASGR